MYDYTRPNRLTERKDEDYHLRFGKYCIGMYERSYHYYLVNKWIVNTAFYKGNQWIFDEDLDAFFQDETGDIRNRIKVVHNIVKPYVEYLRGSVVRMDINFQVDSVSSEAINRRDTALQSLLIMHRAMEEATPATASAIKSKFNLGDTPEETTQNFNNLWSDKFPKNIKHFIKWVSSYENDFEEIKNCLGEDLALAGICIPKEDDRNGMQKLERIRPSNFGFDLSARKRDLSDAEFMFDFDLLSAPDILEEHPDLTPNQRLEIEAIRLSSAPALHNISDALFGIQHNKVPRYCTYWRDIELRKHAAVLDKFGYARLVDLEEGEYTEKDIIPNNKLEQYKDGNDWIDTILGGKNVKNIPIDMVRFCKFIPSIFTDSLSGDIVLDYGLRKYSQYYSYGRKQVEFPYKPMTYAYIDGEIISPVDALINPQRYMNRVLSVAESAINNSGGANYFIDGDSIADGEGIDGVQRNMNQSKPVQVFAGRQMNNAVIPYDKTVKAGTLNMFTIAQNIKGMADDSIGGGEALRGGGGAYRVSTGAAEQNLNQGTILQESYFYALEKSIFNCYESIMNRGRRIYIANGREISMVLGDSEYVLFRLTKEYEAEDFRLKVERSAPEQDQKVQANNALFQLLQGQLIDGKILAKYYNNSDMSDIGYAIREYQVILEEKAKIAQKLQAAQQQDVEQKQQAIAGGTSAQQLLQGQKNDAIDMQDKNSDLALRNRELDIKQQQVNNQKTQTSKKPVKQ